MSEVRRSRGRPKGTEIDDSKVMTAIATTLAAHPGIKPRAAMRRHKPDATDTEFRRWHAKWAERGDDYLHAAKAHQMEVKQKEQARLAQAELKRLSEQAGLRYSSASKAMFEAVCGTYESSIEKAMRECYGSSAVEAMHREMKASREAIRRLDERMMGSMNDPVMRAALGLGGDALSRSARGLSSALWEDAARGVDSTSLSKLARSLRLSDL